MSIRSVEGLDELIKIYLAPEELFEQACKQYPRASSKFNIRFQKENKIFCLTLRTFKLFRLKTIESAIQTQLDIIPETRFYINHITKRIGARTSETQRQWLEVPERPMALNTLVWRTETTYLEINTFVSSLESKARISATVGKHQKEFPK